MSEWKKRSTEVIDHHYIVILFDVEHEDGDKSEEMDIFRYDGIAGIFRSKNNNYQIKYKEIKFWLPIPSKP